MADQIEHSDHPLVRNRPVRFWTRRKQIGGRRRAGVRRACLVAIAFCSSILFLGLIGGGLFFMRLAQGPIDIGLGPQIAAALGGKSGGRYVFSIGSTAVEQTEHGPTLTIKQLDVRDRNGQTVMAAPRAGLTVDPFALAFGVVSPKRLEVQDILLRVIRRADGQVAISAGGDQTADRPLSNALTKAPDDLAAAAKPSGAPPPHAAPIRSGVEQSAVSQALTSVVNGLVDTLFDPGSPFRALDRFGITRGTLVVEDRARGNAMRYRNFAVDFDRDENGGVYLTTGADGPAGHWSVAAQANRSGDGSKTLNLAVDHLSMDEWMLAGGLRRVAFDTDMPLSTTMTLAVAPDGKLSKAEGRVSFGAGYFRLDDPDHEPAMVDGIDAPFRVDPLSGAVHFESGRLQAGETFFQFDVEASPPAKAGDPWRMTGNAKGLFGTERPGEQPVSLDRIGIGLQVYPDLDKLVVDHFTVNGPEVAFKLNATFQGKGSGFLLTSNMEAGRMPGPVLIRLWPNWVAAPPRAWFLANLRGGTLDYGRGRFALTDTDIERMKEQHSVPDDHSRIEFGISNASLSFMDGVPPLQGLDGTGVITGDTVNFTATKGEMEVSPGHKLFLSDGTFTVPSTDPKPSPAVIGLRVTGNIDALGELLSEDALKPYANLPIDASAVQGQIDGRLTVNLKLGSHDPATDTRIGVVATAKDFSADKLIGKEALTNATLNIVADRSSIRAKGEGRMYGAPASIDLKKLPNGAPSNAVVGVTLDDAARAKVGINLGRTVTGPISAKITTSLTQADKSKAAVELDFTHAVFDAPLPGLKKAAGRSAKATFTVTQGDDGVLLDQIVFDSGATSIRGSAELGKNGEFEKARLSQLRLSPGDDMRAEATQSGDTLKLVVRASNLDARPFLKTITAGESGAANEPAGKNLELDLHANLLTGQNNQASSNTELRLTRKGGQFRRVQMSGRLGRGAVSVNTVGQGPRATIVVAAKDAGATLAFFDLYKRMDGGQLDMSLRQVGPRLDGYATVHNFTIREDPAIKKLAQEDIPGNSRNAGAHIDASAVTFTKLEATFTRTGNRVDIHQGSMFGPQVGATVEGSIDFGRDRVALNGTFVPIYGINNLFSQIPVVGLLLGGGAHEGLFALNYRIDGSASAPVLSFNPLSALAPGFLRKIFGAIDSAAQGIDVGNTAETGAIQDHAAGPGHGSAPQ